MVLSDWFMPLAIAFYGTTAYVVGYLMGRWSR